MGMIVSLTRPMVKRESRPTVDRVGQTINILDTCDISSRKINPPLATTTDQRSK